jgi:hypothetical protein
MNKTLKGISLIYWRPFLMFYPDANDPYGQQSLSYQSYEAYSDPRIPKRNETVSPSPLTQENMARTLQVRPYQARPNTPRKSKAETLAFVHECKKWLVAGSVIAFGLLGGLVAGHAVGTTSNQATPASNTPATSPSTGGGFFDQQPGQQQGGGGGSGFGNNNSSQPPVSGSHTS